METSVDLKFQITSAFASTSFHLFISNIGIDEIIVRKFFLIAELPPLALKSLFHNPIQRTFYIH